MMSFSTESSSSWVTITIPRVKNHLLMKSYSFRASSHCSYSERRHCRFSLAVTRDIHLTDTQGKPTGTHAYTACGNLQASSAFKETVQRTQMTRAWYRKDRKTQVNTEELRVFLSIETKKSTFSQLVPISPKGR